MISSYWRLSCLQIPITHLSFFNYNIYIYIFISFLDEYQDFQFVIKIQDWLNIPIKATSLVKLKLAQKRQSSLHQTAKRSWRFFSSTYPMSRPDQTRYTRNDRMSVQIGKEKVFTFSLQLCKFSCTLFSPFLLTVITKAPPFVTSFSFLRPHIEKVVVLQVKRVYITIKLKWRKKEKECLDEFLLVRKSLYLSTR